MRDPILTAFLGGLSMQAISEITQIDPMSPAEVEGTIRRKLTENQPARVAESPAENAVAVTQSVHCTTGADSSSGPGQASTAAQRQPKKGAAASSPSPSVLDLSGYPPPLRHPNAEAQRQVYDALKAYGAQGVREIAQRTCLGSDSVTSALGQLRRKCMAKKKDGWGGEWELTVEVAQ